MDMARQHTPFERTGLAAPVLVLGAGFTGRSVVRWLHGQGVPCTLADTRATPPGAADLRREWPGLPLRFGDAETLDPARFGTLVASPGLPADLPLLRRARAAGVPVVGDIELFARVVDRPVLAVTGSNGKSTVVDMVAAMARAAGRRPGLGGNFGTPALDLLAEDHDCHVLELSSFQLETTESLRPLAACLLNVSEDHMDRHPSLAEYAAIKGRIYRGARRAVVNRDDALAAAQVPAGVATISFGADAPPPGHYGLRRAGGREWLCRGERRLLATDALRVMGRHNALNALAALALGEALGLPEAAMCEALRQYRGLPHRSQWVADIDGVRWVNDSKATNVGATAAALAGLDRPVILLAGGQGKGADFTPLRAAVAGRVRAALLFGEDAPRLAGALAGSVPVERVADLDSAVTHAAALARPGDCVLLSPACASFDQFSGYAERGERFAARVRALAGEETS